MDCLFVALFWTSFLINNERQRRSQHSFPARMTWFSPEICGITSQTLSLPLHTGAAPAPPVKRALLGTQRCRSSSPLRRTTTPHAPGRLRASFAAWQAAGTARCDGAGTGARFRPSRTPGDRRRGRARTTPAPAPPALRQRAPPPSLGK